MSRKSRERKKLEIVPEDADDLILPPDDATLHPLTGELHDTLEAIISGCALLVRMPAEALFEAASDELLEVGQTLDDVVDDLDGATDEEIDDALDSAVDSLGEALGTVNQTTGALARILLARVLDRDPPFPGAYTLPPRLPLSRADRNAALDEAALVLREVGLEDFDVWCEVEINPDGTTELLTRPLSPETAHVELLEFLFERAESVVVGFDGLLVAERDASAWEFSRWSVSPPPGARSSEMADFTRHVREQEYSLADRRTITFGTSVIGELARDDGFAEVFPRQHRLAGALVASFVDVFECVAIDEDLATFRSVRDGRTYDVHEHSEWIEYDVGWVCAGRLLPYSGTLHLRSPGMIFVQPGAAEDLARNAAAAMETLGRTLPPALALEGVISSVFFGVSVPRARKPAPTRAVARETLDALRALLADPEFADATPDATLEGFMAALADQGEAGGAQPGQQKARRAKRAKRRR